MTDILAILALLLAVAAVSVALWYRRLYKLREQACEYWWWRWFWETPFDKEAER